MSATLDGCFVYCLFIKNFASEVEAVVETKNKFYFINECQHCREALNIS